MTGETELIGKIKAFAAKHGYFLREPLVHQTVKGLLANEEKYGKIYCPCRRVKPEDPEYCRKIECPCEFVHLEVSTKGHCQCRLFWAQPDGNKPRQFTF